MIITPPYLKSGDKIRLISPGSRIDSVIVDSGVELLKSLGFNVEVGKYTLSSFNQYSAKEEERAQDLHEAIDDSEVKAIFCTRGGYGSLRTAELVDWTKLIKSPKWLIGFSDVTVLHSKLNKLKISSIHGVMPKYFTAEGKPSESFKHLMEALSGKKLEYKVQGNIFNREGSAKAPIVGGNLSILYSLRGTAYDITTKGKILFIEDLSEYKYHIDRMMMNLKVGGKLSELKGLLVGSFSDIKDNNTPFGKSVEEIILDSVKDYNYPVIFNFPGGHTKDNYPLKLGMKVKIKVGKEIASVVQE